MNREVFECDGECKKDNNGRSNGDKTFVVDCTGESDDFNNINKMDLSNQACTLVRARGKDFFVRVGGGDNWFDIYMGVRNYNLDISGFVEGDSTINTTLFKLHAMGGAAATVSPFGWTFQGYVEVFPILIVINK